MDTTANLINFGEFIRNKRMGAGLGLRKFCELLGKDPSNWSKIERGRMPITEDQEELEKIADLLSIKKGAKDWQTLFDLAFISRKKIPDYVYEDEEVLNALPIFFRTASGNKPSKEELDKIIELLKGR